eukprot:EG_transcript_49403
MRAANNFATLACLRTALRPRYHGTADTGVLDYLLKVEKDGEDYYRELAARAPNPGFKYIFTMLADEEAKHYRAIEELQASGDLSLEKSTILGETRNTFEQLKADPNAKITATKDQIDLYLEAR